MSKLNDLINKLCPDGVYFVKLGEVCEIKTGKGITQKDCSDAGEYPVYSGGKEPMGYYHKYNRDENTVTVSRVGAYAGYVNFVFQKFYLNDKCFSVIPIQDNVNSKYLFYKLKSIEQIIINLQSGGGVPTINTKKVGNLEIPLPPIEVQNEIVRILDKFTQLEAELEAELDCRKRQYEFYRDQLLSFDKITPPERNNVVWKKLSEVCKINRGKRLVKKELMTEGKIPVYQNSLTPLGYYKEANYPADTTFIISAGAAGNIGFSKMDFWAADDCICLVCDKNLNSKYLYYTMTNRQCYFLSRVRKASVPRLSRETINKFEIAIPPIEEQNRIVAILDRFESLTISLQHGLPAEIAARRQQYEYYRDKLLDFKRKTA